MSPAPVLTVDGPGGSGKGTVCRLVQARTGWHLLDSGAIYRALAVAADRRGLSVAEEAELVDLAHYLALEFRPDEGGEPRVLLAGDDITSALRAEQTGNLASQLAVVPAVRQALLARQRAFRASPGLIADGRDMGTVVFPDATVKVFLTATVEERARRRHKQLKEQGVGGNLADLLKEISERDQRDRSRSVAPLIPAEDAVVLDTTGASIETVVDRVMRLLTQVTSHNQS